MLNTQSVTRRDFLGGLACGSAIAAMPALAAEAGPGAPWRMRLSTSSIHFSSLPIEQACERIAALGFEAIDIWASFGKCRHLKDVADRLGGGGLRFGFVSVDDGLA